ncbi:MAG: class I SAM-dependent methyltransferase [Thermoplasmata archaeon]
MTEVKKRPLEGLLYDREGFRMSTPKEIASYLAERLAGGTVADIGCGIGVQTISFAERSERVVAVDMNRERLEMCRKNCERMNLGNVDFILGDALSKSVVARVGDVNIVHSDPSRVRTGRWSMDSLSPNPLLVSREYDGDKCFDLPALMPQSEIPKGWEMEFISLGGELKRLCAYTGDLKIYEKSALSLPQGARVVYDMEIDRKVEIASKPLHFIYDVDASISVSGLLPEFLSSNVELRIIHEDSQRTLATSSVPADNPFIARKYEVMGEAVSLTDLRKKIEEMDAGKVYLRFSVEPSKYYELKGRLERGLRGSSSAYIFRFGDRFYAAAKAQ